MIQANSGKWTIIIIIIVIILYSRDWIEFTQKACAKTPDWKLSGLKPALQKFSSIHFPRVKPRQAT